MTDTTTEPTPRGPGRPRNADRQPQHVAGAAEREPMRDPAHEQPRTRTRMRRASVMDDPFYIPLEWIPEGMSVEWKRHSVHGMEDDFYIAQMRRQGWEPVDPRTCAPKLRQLVPEGYDKPNLIKAGQILMERPIELTREAIAEARSMSRQQVNEAEERLGRKAKELSSKDLIDDDPVKAKIQREWNRPIPTAIED